MKRFIASVSVVTSLLASPAAFAGTYVVKSRAPASTPHAVSNAAGSSQGSDLASKVGKLVEGRALRTVRAPTDSSAKGQLTALTRDILKQQLARVPGVGGVLASTAEALVPVIVEQVWSRVQDRVVTGPAPSTGGSRAITRK